MVQSVEQGARNLMGQVAEPAIALKRRELAVDLQKAAPFWLQGMVSMLRGAISSGLVSASRPGDLPIPSSRSGGLTLVDDDTIEHEILSSRLALAMMDRASWEFADLRSRIGSLEGARGPGPERRAAAACAGAHRHGVVACRRPEPGFLAGSADGAPR